MLNLKKLTPHLGVEILDVNLSRALETSLRDEINQALAENGFVMMRGQQLSVEQFMAFGRQIGPLAVHSLKQYSKPGFPELMINSNIVENGKPIGLVDGGQHWHTDGAYLEMPYRATMLYAAEVPVKDGVALGDTVFSSTAAAYDALSPELKSRLGPMRAEHRHGVGRAKKGYGAKHDLSQSAALTNVVEHPVIRSHPVTGRNCLYVNPGSTLRLLDTDAAESDAMIATLCDHAVRPEFQYRHNWRVGDVVMWDNCSTQHCAIGGYQPLRRLMYRVIVQGGRTH